ncbi:putative phage tail protein [Moorella sp. E306M]|uniref:putative phage tail protein n=1 Tax=Moorella sp. E306M TaxID=2572683 RepID=UPI0010FFB5F5|nr:putative phage tail protein [Moorella sp. E306M]GEA17485.1 hypothetical protein E306M_06190 [Moorella sp. E306M]
MSREPAKDRMIEYLPLYYRTSKVMEAILSAQGQEIDKLFEALDQTLEQFFVVSATWGLRYWGELLGLPVNETLPVDERRRQILAKRRGVAQPLLVILQAIAPELEARFGGDVIPFVRPIEHNASEYDFGLLVPTLEIHKPAHKAYTFQLLPPDQASGYVIYGNHAAGRGKVAFQPEAGAVYAGRWPRWNTAGQAKTGSVTARAAAITGECLFPMAGVSIGSMGVSDVILPAVVGVGGAIFPRSGQYRAAELPIIAAAGALAARAASIAGLGATGWGATYPCGTIHAGEAA